MERDLLTILTRDNPWILDSALLGSWLNARLPAGYIQRDVSTRDMESAHRAHLVIGPRQAGKSTFLWTWLARRQLPALFVDCEQRLVRDWCRSAPLFLESLSTLVSAPPILLFDEVQHLEEAGLFIKGLIDRRYESPILVTGSSSYHLGAHTRESLAGRATRNRLLPFSFREVTQDILEKPSGIRDRLLTERFERHVVWGGYPDVWLSKEPSFLLHELVEAFVLRDASDRFHIQRPDVFRQLLGLLARQVGSLINHSEWASILGVSRDSVGAYLAILEECHVVATIRPFIGGRRAELTSRPKVYLVDNGIRNHLISDLRLFPERADQGAVLENWVFSELWKILPQDQILRFWRSSSGAEVDFVLSVGERLAAVEVKAQALREPRLPRSSRSFIEAHHPEVFFLVNSSLEHSEMLSGTLLKWTTPWKMPQEIRAWLQPEHRSGPQA